MMNSPSGQPSIELFGITIMEPMVTFTDLWVTAVCVFAFIKLGKSSSLVTIKSYIRYYFLCMGTATLIGGIFGHAFQYNFGMGWKIPSWVMSSVGLFCIQKATLLFVRPLINDVLNRFINGMVILVFISMTYLTVIKASFLYVQIHLAIGFLLVVLPLHSYAYMKTHNKGSKYFVLSTLLLSSSLAVYLNNIQLSIWFNHLDIAHTIMAISLFFFYKGSLKFGTLKQGNVLKMQGSVGNS